MSISVEILCSSFFPNSGQVLEEEDEIRMFDLENSLKIQIRCFPPAPPEFTKMPFDDF